MFMPGFPKLLRFQEHHDNILKKFLPKLKKYMVRWTLHYLCEINQKMAVIDWFNKLI